MHAYGCCFVSVGMCHVCTVLSESYARWCMQMCATATCGNPPPPVTQARCALRVASLAGAARRWAWLLRRATRRCAGTWWPPAPACWPPTRTAVCRGAWRTWPTSAALQRWVAPWVGGCMGGWAVTPWPGWRRPQAPAAGPVQRYYHHLHPAPPTACLPLNPVLSHPLNPALLPLNPTLPPSQPHSPSLQALSGMARLRHLVADDDMSEVADGGGPWLPDTLPPDQLVPDHRPLRRQEARDAKLEPQQQRRQQGGGSSTEGGGSVSGSAGAGAAGDGRAVDSVAGVSEEAGGYGAGAAAPATLRLRGAAAMEPVVEERDEEALVAAMRGTDAAGSASRPGTAQSSLRHDPVPSRPATPPGPGPASAAPPPPLPAAPPAAAALTAAQLPPAHGLERSVSFSEPVVSAPAASHAAPAPPQSARAPHTSVAAAGTAGASGSQRSLLDHHQEQEPSDSAHGGVGALGQSQGSQQWAGATGGSMQHGGQDNWAGFSQGAGSAHGPGGTPEWAAVMAAAGPTAGEAGPGERGGGTMGSAGPGVFDKPGAGAGGFGPGDSGRWGGQGVAGSMGAPGSSQRIGAQWDPEDSLAALVPQFPAPGPGGVVDEWAGADSTQDAAAWAAVMSSAASGGGEDS